MNINNDANKSELFIIGSENSSNKLEMTYNEKNVFYSIVNVIVNLNIKNKNQLIASSDYIFKKLENRSVTIENIGKKRFTSLFLLAINYYSKNNENCHDIHLTKEDLKFILREKQIRASYNIDRLQEIKKKKEQESMGSNIEEYVVFKDYESNTLYGEPKSKIEELQRKSPDNRSQYENELIAAYENPQIEKVKFSEMARLEASYDKLAKAQKNIMHRSKQIHAVLRKNRDDDPPVKVKNLIIGAGFAGEQHWRSHFKRQHKSVDARLRDNKLPDTLIIAGKEGFGNWQKGADYVLGQPHSFLEQPNRTNPSDFTTEASYMHNKHVISRHLNQAHRINLDENQAPVSLGTECIKVESQKEGNWDDWKVPNAKARAKLQIMLNETETLKKEDYPAEDYRDGKKSVRYVEKINPDTGLQEQRKGSPVYLKQTILDRTVYADTIDVCTGMGRAKSLLAYYGNAIDKATYESLSKYDASKGLTPLIDSNSAILSNRLRNEIKNTPDAQTLVLGAGANSAACSGELLEHNQKIIWLVRSDLTTAGHGTHIDRLVNLAADAHVMAKGDITKIEEKEGRIEVWVLMPQTKKDFKIRYFDQIIVPNSQIYKNKERALIKNKEGQDEVRELCRLSVDRIIYATGQDDTKTAQMLQGVTLEMNEVSPPEDFPGRNIPVGLKTADGAIRIWGGAAVGAEVGKQVKKIRKKTFTSAVSDHMQAEHFSDNAGPGTMPPSVEHIKLGGGITPDLSSINVNATDRARMYLFFQNAGIDALTAERLTEDIWNARERIHGKGAEALQREELEDILRKYPNRGVLNKVDIVGHYQLALAKSY
jgi:hypothetical protein